MTETAEGAASHGFLNMGGGALLARLDSSEAGTEISSRGPYHCRRFGKTEKTEKPTKNAKKTLQFQGFWCMIICGFVRNGKAVKITHRIT